MKPEIRVLLIDCCGDEPMLAVAEGERICAQVLLGECGAAAGWLPAVRRLLAAQDWRLGDLDVIGVVGGPGSFTGVRTGVAAAKGLAEAARLKLAVVSRLAVLAEAAGQPEAAAVLFAGRDQLYVRWPGKGDAEELVGLDAFERTLAGSPVVAAEERLTGVLARKAARRVNIRPEHVLKVVQEALAAGGSSVADADANYVRAESEIYRMSGPRPVETPDRVLEL